MLAELRPNYGFALYEIGRTYRLMGEFAKAITHLEQAQSIPVEYRDVGDPRIDLEKSRARDSSRDYP